MSKIKVHTYHTYETTDGRSFDDVSDAANWQKVLDVFSEITMLDSNMEPTRDVDSAFYVHIRTCEQLKAFNAMQKYEGLRTEIPDLGVYLYEDRSDDFLSIEAEINRLKDIQRAIYTASEQLREAQK